MRVLFTTQPGSGMFNPLVPFAHALTLAGHTVAFASADCFRPDIEAVGFTTFPRRARLARRHDHPRLSRHPTARPAALTLGRSALA